MPKLSVALVSGLCLVGLAACAANRSEAENPDSAKGVASDSLNRQQQARIALLGRTSAPTRYTEKIDGNRVRVVAIDFGGTRLGQCSDLAGSLLPGVCKPASAVEPQPTNSGSPSAPLNSGMFRQYSTQVGTTVEAKLAIGPGAVETTVYVSRNFLVLEWRRYSLVEFLQYGALADASQYFVSSLENGVAIRIVFDVTLQTTDAKLSANFGIVDLSTALARNEATVEVSYEVLGTNLDLMPGNAIVVTSLKEYLDILGEFYRIVGVVSRATQAWAAVGGPDAATGTQAAEIDLNAGTSSAPNKVKIQTNTFKPAVLAYYVSGAGVGENYAKLRNVEACEDIQARNHHLIRDLTWHRSMIEHHQAVPIRHLNHASKVALQRAITEVRDVQAAQRELMAEAAALSCVRTCAANAHRLKQVCPQVGGSTRESIDCQDWLTKNASEIDDRCRSDYEWVYDDTFPLDVRRPKRTPKSKPAAHPGTVTSSSKGKISPRPAPKTSVGSKGAASPEGTGSPTGTPSPGGTAEVETPA